MQSYDLYHTVDKPFSLPSFTFFLLAPSLFQNMNGSNPSTKKCLLLYILFWLLGSRKKQQHHMTIALKTLKHHHKTGTLPFYQGHQYVPPPLDHITVKLIFSLIDNFSPPFKVWSNISTRSPQYMTPTSLSTNNPLYETLAAYTWHCPAEDVNMKYNRSCSNVGLVGV